MSEEDFAKLLGETRKFIGAGRPDKIAANLAMTAATTAESLNRRALAIEAYQYYGKLLAGRLKRPIGNLRFSNSFMAHTLARSAAKDKTQPTSGPAKAPLQERGAL